MVQNTYLIIGFIPWCIKIIASYYLKSMYIQYTYTEATHVVGLFNSLSKRKLVVNYRQTN